MLKDSKKLKMMKGEQADPSSKVDEKKQPQDGKDPWCLAGKRSSRQSYKAGATRAWKPSAQPNLDD
eukprot:5035308-Amphidinium_carterae.1